MIAKLLFVLSIYMLISSHMIAQQVVSVNPAITMRAQSISGGRGVQVNWSTTWGSFSKSGSTKKAVGVAISTLSGTPQAVMVEGFLIVKQDGSKETYKQMGKSKAIAVNGKPYTLAFVSELNDQHDRYAALGIESKGGERVRGWMVRAYDEQKRIIAVVSSLKHYDKLAYEIAIE